MNHYFVFDHSVFWHATEYITTGYMTSNLSENKLKSNSALVVEAFRTRMRLSGSKCHDVVRFNAGTLIPRGM
jgi:hypothetical protein